MKDVKTFATDIRKRIITMAHRTKSPHVGSCLSCVEILSVLYTDILRLSPWEERDICILSKAHAAMALYSTLAQRNIIDESLLQKYFCNDGILPAHLDRFSCKGVEVSAGSLGHGFNIGLGWAYGFKKQGSTRNVYAIIGDGESQEGSIWEGALFAPALGLNNFTAVLDYNNLQGYGRAKEICEYEPVRKKWEAFGWHVCETSGHDVQQLHAAFKDDSRGKPKMIIACTVKGKGVSFMEDQLTWHYYMVTDELKEKALQELEGS